MESSASSKVQAAEAGQPPAGTQAILIGLTVPTVMVMVNASMFSVALPAIRNSFNARADLIAWVVIGYSLSYVILMPLYGRLGDALGKRKLYLAGTAIFLLGTCLNILARGLPLLMTGRVMQGVGASGVIPLAIAMISERFPANQRGKALGTWNSVGPAARIVAPLMAGFLIDTWGWRTIFYPPLITGLLVPLVMYRCLPAAYGKARPGLLCSFDWIGVASLGAAVTTFLFYVSSEPITGASPLQDWRLLAMASLLISGFIMWERRRSDPFISLQILFHRLFARASLCAGLRMFTMSGISFLLPLYLADVKKLGAGWIGVALVVHSVALLATLRLGGQLADCLGSSRWPVFLGLSLQVAAMITFANLPGTAGLAPVLLGLAAHGLGAGLALAALHRVAMGGVPQEEMGVAAGLYSMIRFFGTVLGITLGGVLLRQGLGGGLPAIDAYRMVYWFIASVGALGALIGLTLR